MSATNYYSISQLQQIITSAVRTSPAGRGMWVTAELLDVRQSGGHCYMELIEKDDSGHTVAKIRGTIWRNVYTALRKKFYQATGSDIVSGLKVMVGGMADNHPLYGLSFNIRDIDPSYTMGDMERIRREIIQTLSREGVADLNKRLSMCEVPQRIAVISSDTAAGYGDFQDQLLQNQYGIVFYPHLFPAIMQGDRTSSSIREAMQSIYDSIDLWDCVVIIRGGGATSDLHGFDDLDLARAVATFPLPVIVGIGHERDRTVLDELAHTRIKTPTGVASFLVERAASYLAHFQNTVQQIARYATEYLNGEKRRLASTAAIIPTLGSNMVHRASDRLDNLRAIISTALTQRLSTQRMRIDAAAGLIAAYSPERTLMRGYSITRIDGKAITNAADIPTRAILTTTLAHGTLTSTLTP